MIKYKLKRMKIKQLLQGRSSTKSKACSIVLRLMDMDYSYPQALKIALHHTKAKKQALETELSQYI